VGETERSDDKEVEWAATEALAEAEFSPGSKGSNPTITGQAECSFLLGPPMFSRSEPAALGGKPRLTARRRNDKNY
jgi:hypothetical protein